MVQNDPYISVGVENGRLLISGLSHPAVRIINMSE